MKLYVLDEGWLGAAICVAESKEEAFEKMKNSDFAATYEEFDQRPFDDGKIGLIEEYDLAEVITTEGDI